jgi:hypothetical protein
MLIDQKCTWQLSDTRKQIFQSWRASQQSTQSYATVNPAHHNTTESSTTAALNLQNEVSDENGCDSPQFDSSWFIMFDTVHCVRGINISLHNVSGVSIAIVFRWWSCNYADMYFSESPETGSRAKSETQCLSNVPQTMSKLSVVEWA